MVLAGAAKGTARSGQEYVDPLLVITGDEYEAMPFGQLHAKLCDALRGDRVPVVAQVVSGEGMLIIYADGDAREANPR